MECSASYLEFGEEEHVLCQSYEYVDQAIEGVPLDGRDIVGSRGAEHRSFEVLYFSISVFQYFSVFCFRFSVLIWDFIVFTDSELKFK